MLGVRDIIGSRRYFKDVNESQSGVWTGIAAIAFLVEEYLLLYSFSSLNPKSFLLSLLTEVSVNRVSVDRLLDPKECLKGDLITESYKYRLLLSSA